MDLKQHHTSYTLLQDTAHAKYFLFTLLEYTEQTTEFHSSLSPYDFVAKRSKDTYNHENLQLHKNLSFDEEKEEVKFTVIFMVIIIKFHTKFMVEEKRYRKGKLTRMFSLQDNLPSHYRVCIFNILFVLFMFAIVMIAELIIDIPSL